MHSKLPESGLEKYTGIEFVVLQFQSTNRHSEAWAESLRYGHPDVDHMNGLRRLTMNNNPLIGDNGIIYLSDALKDDMWLKG